ncbi:hypothetical protein I8748_16590 [Nostoc sp. CENA67]|uniref:Uncharacterized protein n=1 Tax=Amazonocrinis nigriterrae CENA67 TaxID=2794033 RepID=A0A8J7HWT9_9NOST|nr:hypothetical protein [Amazonocrinis nigriterrae]MBH8563789.1 hypothetical protein [Amazonocrinis nigriterrae CENA67]
MIWAVGQKLHRNKYEIKEELGRGRFAITYLAENTASGVDGLIKIALELVNPQHLKNWFTNCCYCTS